MSQICRGGSSYISSTTQTSIRCRNVYRNPWWWRPCPRRGSRCPSSWWWPRSSSASAPPGTARHTCMKPLWWRWTSGDTMPTNLAKTAGVADCPWYCLRQRQRRSEVEPWIPLVSYFYPSFIFIDISYNHTIMASFTNVYNVGTLICPNGRRFIRDFEWFKSNIKSFFCDLEL